MIWNRIRLLVITLCITGAISRTYGEEKEQIVAAAGDMLDWSFGLTFALAEQLDDPESANGAVNVFALRYFLLCRGEKAILPPRDNIEDALTHQRTMRLRDEDLLEDPLNVGKVLTPEKVSDFNQCGGRAYAIATASDYHSIIEKFHKWLRSLK